MMQKEKTVCFTGHRSLPTGMGLGALKKQIRDEIEKSLEDGYNRFLFGAAIGFDMICGELLVERKKRILFKKPMPFEVIAVVPFEEQATKYSVKDHERYYELLSKCDDVVTLNTHYTSDCYKQRNQYMVDRSSKLIAYYDGGFRSGTGQTVRMAEKQNLKIINLY